MSASVFEAEKKASDDFPDCASHHPAAPAPARALSNEWGVHATAFAKQVGLTEDQLAATAAVTDQAAADSCWSQRDALLIRLADELHDTATVSDPLWSQLAHHHTDQQLLELIVTAGWYRTLAYVINAARVPLERWAGRFPAQER